MKGRAPIQLIFDYAEYSKHRKKKREDFLNVVEEIILWSHREE